MKRLIQTSVLAIVCLVAFHVAAIAGNDKPISVAQLPVTAQQVIKKYFGGNKVALAKMDTEFLGKTYDVIFTNGDKLEFNKKGVWTEIDCKSSSVPNALVPAKIASYVRGNYPGEKILKIEKDDGNYDVKLSNRMEITFNKKFQVTDID